MNDRFVVGRTSVLLGVPVDDVTLAEAVERIAEMVEYGRSTGATHQVATVNVDFVVNAQADPALLATLQQTDLAVPDGMPLVWASRLVGTGVRERTTGIDLLPAIAERSARDGWRLLLFGGAPGVADRAADLLRDRASGLSVHTVAAPAVGADGRMPPDVVAALRAHRPDIVCVALGNPKQERWIDRYRVEVGAPVYIGIGGSLDFLTGATTRAPAWMRRSGLEWLHRAVSEPRRLLGRYAHDFLVFAPAITRQAWRGRRRRAAEAPCAQQVGDVLTLTVTGRPPPVRLEPALAKQLHEGGPVAIELTGRDPLDNVTVSWLVGLARDARRRHTSLGVTPGAGDEDAWAAVGGRGALVGQIEPV